MSDLNKVFLTGRLAKDPDTKYTSSGQALTKIDVAVNRRVKKGENWVDEAMFFNNITIWGKQAETVRDYFHRGDQIIVEGRLGVDEWEAPDGAKRRQVTITMENFSFGAKKGGGQGGRSPRNDQGAYNEAPSTSPPPPTFPPEPQGEDDDVPF